MKKKKKVKGKISVEDYLKAVKKADREIQLEKSPGWVRATSVHTNKKAYNRRAEKRKHSEE